MRTVEPVATMSLSYVYVFPLSVDTVFFLMSTPVAVVPVMNSIPAKGKGQITQRHASSAGAKWCRYVVFNTPACSQGHTSNLDQMKEWKKFMAKEGKTLQHSDEQ